MTNGPPEYDRLRAMIRGLCSLFILLPLMFSCTRSHEKKVLREKLSTLLQKNPEILSEVIAAHPLLFSEALQKAIARSREQLAQRRALQEKNDFYQSFENPLEPEIRSDDVVRGNPNGKIILVEYVDFECPFCERGYQTMNELTKMYGAELKVILKHLPLSFHENAMPAARYYEALRLQNHRYAKEFYHQVFRHQRQLSHGEIFLREVAKEVGADMELLGRDLMNNESIDERIRRDLKEAKRFGIRGTPGFILNGIPIRGAYPSSHFVRVIRELERRNMIELDEHHQKLSGH